MQRRPMSEGDIESSLREIRSLRRQGLITAKEAYERHVALLSGAPEAPPAADAPRAAGDSLEQKVTAFEESLNQLRTTNRGQDGIRWPTKRFRGRRCSRHPREFIRLLSFAVSRLCPSSLFGR